MRLLHFNVVAEHIPGKQLVITDTLSRQPLSEVSDGELEHEVQAYVESVVANAPVSSQRLSEIRTATQQDGELLQIIAFIRNGWPPKSRMLPSLQPYFSARAHLSETDGLVLYKDRIVLPVALRSAILEQIHGGHQGLTRCRARARMSVWWPRISGEITQKVHHTSHQQAQSHVREMGDTT